MSTVPQSIWSATLSMLGLAASIGLDVDESLRTGEAVMAAAGASPTIEELTKKATNIQRVFRGSRTRKALQSEQQKIVELTLKEDELDNATLSEENRLAALDKIIELAKGGLKMAANSVRTIAGKPDGEYPTSIKTKAVAALPTLPVAGGARNRRHGRKTRRQQ